MNENELSLIAGVFLSLSFSYIPGLNAWYAALEPTQKRLVMLALLLASALGLVGLSCIDAYTQIRTGFAALACTPQGLWDALRLFIQALAANQAAFLVAPRQPKAASVPPGAGTPAAAAKPTYSSREQMNASLYRPRRKAVPRPKGTVYQDIEE